MPSLENGESDDPAREVTVVSGPDTLAFRMSRDSQVSTRDPNDHDRVVVTPYDASWPLRYEEERRRIVDALGDLLLAVEHVGSTAVPGLCAKPIVDILAGLRRFEDGERCVAPLEALNYEYRGEAGVPGRLFFRKFTGERRTHHLHVVELDGREWRRHILFRDALRRNGALASEYGQLKTSLAGRLPRDRERYTEAKAPFIERVLSRAD